MGSLEAEDELAPGPCFPFPFRSIKELIEIILAIFWKSVLCNSFSCFIMYLVKPCNDKNMEFIAIFMSDVFEVEAQGQPLYSY